MYRRSPAEHFIKYLISLQEHDVDTVMRLVEEHNLDRVTQAYVERLKKEVEVPKGWELTKGDPETRAFLRKHGIHDLWFPTPQVQEAFHILSNPQLRADIEQLLISPMRVEEVTRRINKHHQTSLTADGIQSFGHYFWNKKLLSMRDWMSYLSDRPNHEAMVALRVSPDMASTLVPWSSGLSGPPSSLNTGLVARRVRDVAFLKIVEIERHPATLAHSKMMKNYMDVITDAEAEMRQSDVALKDVLKAFEKFRLRKDGSPIPSIENVAGPNFSQSGEGTSGGRIFANDQVTADDLDEEAEDDEGHD